jgi:hypothetical protein
MLRNLAPIHYRTFAQTNKLARGLFIAVKGGLDDPGLLDRALEEEQTIIREEKV